MKYLYSAPNRAHHVHFAEGLWKHDKLAAFIWAYPRLSGRARTRIPSDLVCSVDFWQTCYLAACRFSLPNAWSNRLDWMSKKTMDRAAGKMLNQADGLIFYNGTGLQTLERYRDSSKLLICEVVNAHVDFQMELLQEEAERFQCPIPKTFEPERKRRIQEYQNADYIFGPSEFVKRTFIDRGFPESKFRVVPYGVSVSEDLPTPPGLTDNKDRESISILYVGQFHLRKGLPYLLKAFQQLKGNKRLVLVGANTPFNNLPDLSGDSTIEIRGVLRGQELEMAFRSADILVLPSIEDAFGLVVPEALGYGIPAIATTHTGSSELIQNGVNGYVVPPRDADAIEAILEKIQRDPALRANLKQGARQTRHALGSWEKQQDLLVEQLNELAQ